MNSRENEKAHLLKKEMAAEKQNLKVLLCLNGSSDPLRFLHNRQLTLLKYALESQNIEVTFNAEDNYDLVHLLSYRQYVTYCRKVPLKERNVPLVLSLFNSEIKAKVDKKGNYLRPLLKNVYRRYARLEEKKVDKIIVATRKEEQVLRVLGIGEAEIVLPGGRTYDRNDYSSEELAAFRSYYQLNPEEKFVITYGSYTAESMQSIAELSRISPDYDFFYFGPVTNNELSSYRKYSFNKGLRNLHYEGQIPEELYHSMLFSCSALIITDPYHCDVSILIEALKADVPVLAIADPLLEDFYNDERIRVYPSIPELYKGLVQLMKGELVINEDNGNDLSAENYGKNLLAVYQKVLS